MPLIVETIVTTRDAAGTPHIAPLGLIADGERWVIAPFRPSRTLDNLRHHPFAAASHRDRSPHILEVRMRLQLNLPPRTAGAIAVWVSPLNDPILDPMESESVVESLVH